jgi:hypothetical protein
MTPHVAQTLATDAAIRTGVWQWLHRRRLANSYQPDATTTAADRNGCAAKLSAITSSGIDASDKALVSLGASRGYYETGIAKSLTSPGRPLRRAHLVDVDAEALQDGASALSAANVARVRVDARAAEAVRWEARYDIALFLSLFHHYDRLGGSFRETGLSLLSQLAARSQMLLFETGQSDDGQANAEEWRASLLMRGREPLDWLQTDVRSITGYTGFRHLGTNPVTNRHLCLYWHAAALPKWLAARTDADALRAWTSDRYPLIELAGITAMSPMADNAAVDAQLRALPVAPADSRMLVIPDPRFARQAAQFGVPALRLDASVSCDALTRCMASAQLDGVGVFLVPASASHAIRALAQSGSVVLALGNE